MNIDGSAQTRLTKNSAVDSQPAWSPNGKKIVWVSNHSTQAMAEYSVNSSNEIYIMNADGSKPKRLTSNNSDDRKPQWLKAVPTWKLHWNLPYTPTQMLPSRRN
jgi:Tol biopolymer transport system component